MYIAVVSKDGSRNHVSRTALQKQMIADSEVGGAGVDSLSHNDKQVENPKLGCLRLLKSQLGG